VSGRLWLSRLALDPRHQDAAAALRDAQAMHALTMRCLPLGATRSESNLLHYADLSTGVVIVQTTVPPQWPDTPAFQAHAKEITGFVATLDRGSALRFTVRAVPMRRQSARLRNGRAMDAPGEHTLRTDAERLRWLELRLGPAVRLIGAPVVSVEPDRVGHRRGSRFGHRPALFGGRMEVLDAEALRHLVVRGVGRAKSYGNGLLILARTPVG
jgi:CRISPR system Cascade subunit CasE